MAGHVKAASSSLSEWERGAGSLVWGVMPGECFDHGPTTRSHEKIILLISEGSTDALHPRNPRNPEMGPWMSTEG